MSRFLIGLIITAVCVLLLWRVIDWSVTGDALSAADPAFIVLAVACLVGSLFAKTVRWRLLLPENSGLSTQRLYRILHISFLLNNVLPARLGDVARVAMTARAPGLRFGHVLSSLLTERVTDILTLMAAFAAVSPFLPVPDQYVPWLHIAWVTTGVAFALFLGVGLFRRHLGRMSSRLRVSDRIPGAHHLRGEAASFRQGLRQLFSREHVIRIWAWSWIAWLGAFAINYNLMKALDIDAPFTVAVLLTCTTNLAMLIPSSPSYIGVFHAAATLSLLPFDVSSGRALSFAILAHLVNVIPVSILGAAFLLAGHETLPFRISDWRSARAEETLDPVEIHS